MALPPVFVGSVQLKDSIPIKGSVHHKEFVPIKSPSTLKDSSVSLLSVQDKTPSTRSLTAKLSGSSLGVTITLLLA